MRHQHDLRFIFEPLPNDALEVFLQILTCRLRLAPICIQRPSARRRHGIS